MRLQLSSLGRLLAVVLLVALTSSALGSGARAQDWRIALDTLVYDDTDNVTSVSPRLSVRRRLDSDGSALGVYTLLDVVSAASVDVVSQATPGFLEARSETGANAAAAFGDGDFLLSGSYRFSIEPDYMSHGGRLSLRSRLGTPDSVLTVAYGLTGDVVGRSGTPWGTFSPNLFTHSTELSLSQNLGPETVLRGVYVLTIQHGYLEKPYRHVPLFDAAVLSTLSASGERLTLANFDEHRLAGRPGENVPDLRVGHALGLRGLQSIEPIEGSIRLDYQFFFDDWGVTAHTVEAALTGTAVEGLRLVGYGRLYAQTSASFWRRTYGVEDPSAVPTWRTLDRELSSYEMLTGGARLEWEAGEFGGYVDGAVTWTHYENFLFLDDRVALLGQVGLRWTP